MVILNFSPLMKHSNLHKELPFKSIHYTPPENPPTTQEFYSYYELETLNSL